MKGTSGQFQVWAEHNDPSCHPYLFASAATTRAWFGLSFSPSPWQLTCIPVLSLPAGQSGFCLCRVFIPWAPCSFLANSGLVRTTEATHSIIRLLYKASKPHWVNLCKHCTVVYFCKKCIMIIFSKHPSYLIPKGTQEVLYKEDNVLCSLKRLESSYYLYWTTKFQCEAARLWVMISTANAPAVSGKDVMKWSNFH